LTSETQRVQNGQSSDIVTYSLLSPYVFTGLLLHVVEFCIAIPAVFSVGLPLTSV